MTEPDTAALANWYVVRHVPGEPTQTLAGPMPEKAAFAEQNRRREEWGECDVEQRSATDTATLIRQVQQGIGVEYGADQLVYAIAALAELSERLETAERHEGDHSDAICDLKEHLEVAERERDELWEFNQKFAADHYFARAEAAEAEVERLREALTLTYASIDNLCARPGTCMAVRPRAALRDTANGK